MGPTVDVEGTTGEELGPSSPDAAAVDPGSLDAFADYVDSLAEYWADPKGAARKMFEASQDHSGLAYPEMGAFGAAAAFQGEYDTKLETMATSAGQLWDALDGLAKATRKVAENYRSTEELNNAGVVEIQGILTEELGSVAGPGGDESGTGQSGGTEEGMGS